ncbi:E3 ubiquitin-protein ligase TRIM39-like [Podarcis raffonei]|uniref:E3 ubiquitin-protein ligase TRIM39-like n=1 Tax=Podarcis raffonei TaxID=65483 RepID=UPI0023291813|nr:E3 ubiquitin-protein ligase TRIM39-like [Podarcis raffonei]
MEAEGAIEGLCEEATCSICLEYFIDPVTIACGHNFCQACFDQLWEDPNVDSCCPQCRERIKQKNFRPNRQLANMVEIVRNFQERKGLKRKWEEPQRQQEPPKWRDGQAPMGVVWDRLHADQGHAASSISKISVKYKAQLEAEKQKIRSAFQRMQVFLRTKQRLWLGELGDLEKKIWRRGEGNFAELSGELSRLRNLIVATEARNVQPSYHISQPPKESLQDIRRALTRCEKKASEHESDLSHWWDETLKIAVEKSSALEKATEKYKASLEQVQDTAPLMQDLNKVDVTLDPNTAHPCLTVSEDLKSVWWEVEKKRKGGKKKKKKKSNNRGATGNLPDNPERFNGELCVLGQEGFTAGKHWWVMEVETWGRAMWAVGVARDTMRRKGVICTHTNEGVWAVGRFSRSPSMPCQFFAFTFPAPTPLALVRDPQKIRVSLDYERGQVQFSDADTDDLIFTYHTGSFSEEKLRPFFQVRSCGTALKCWPRRPAAVNGNDNARTATGNRWFLDDVRLQGPPAAEAFHIDQGWWEF